MRVILLLVFLLFNYGVNAQSFYLNEAERFAYQVKQLDELIERFNGDEFTVMNEYLGQNNTATIVDRQALIKTLFNSQKRDWNINEIKSFIDYINDKENPVFINFEDDFWFAEAKCSVVYKGKSQKVNLILKVQRESNDGLKWVIVSAKSNFLPSRVNSFASIIPIPLNSTKQINPISHATEFMGLDVALKDRKNVANYLGRDCRNNELLTFIKEMHSNNLIFEQVDTITFHFLQISGWGFTVQKFKRPIKNSGWLVSSLTRMNEEEKEKYLLSVLNIVK